MTTNLPANLQMPAHLAVLQGKNNIAVAAMGGITMGSSFHRISIKQSRWRLNDPQGQEAVVPQLHLDVLIVDANPTQSKIFYASAYNPAETEFKAPDCWSDNGVAPSSRAANPQHVNCGTCPNNVWGSKVTQSGKQSKLCGDVKKLAVILAENPTGPVYELRVPAASLKNLYSFVQSLDGRGIPLSSMVIRLTFDAQADYPLILFTPVNWATPEQVQAVVDVLDTEEVNVVTNKNDKPITAMPAAKAAAPAPAAGMAVIASPALPPQNLQAAALTQPIEQAAPKARVRRTKAEMAASQPAQPAPAPEVAPAPAQPAPAGDFFSQLQAKNGTAPAPIVAAPQPAAQVQVNPPATNAALDDLLAKAFAV